MQMFERMAKFEKESASPSSDSKFSPALAPRLGAFALKLLLLGHEAALRFAGNFFECAPSIRLHSSGAIGASGLASRRRV
jgi:hypothetical protein